MVEPDSEYIAHLPDLLTLGYVIVMGMNVGSLYIMSFSFSFHVRRNTVFCRISQLILPKFVLRSWYLISFL